MSSSFVRQIKNFIPLWIVGVLVFMVVVFGGYYLFQSKQTRQTIALFQITRHSSLDAIRKGIIEELEIQGFSTSSQLRIIYENAHGNITLGAQIAQKFVGIKPDVIVAITTPAAQLAVKAAKGSEIPVVFSAVTDPVKAKLVSENNEREAFITGTIDLPPLEDQLKYIKKLVPYVKTIGALYNVGEVNSRQQIEKLKAYALKEHIYLLEGPVHKPSDIFSVAEKLASKVDVLYVPNDNMVASGIESVVRGSLGYRLPVFASDPFSVRRGATAALSYDQYAIGRETGKIIVRILEGIPPRLIPLVETYEKNFYLNPKAAEKIGLHIPQELLKEAKIQENDS